MSFFCNEIQEFLSLGSLLVGSLFVALSFFRGLENFYSFPLMFKFFAFVAKSGSVFQAFAAPTIRSFYCLARRL